MRESNKKKQEPKVQLESPKRFILTLGVAICEKFNYKLKLV
jgi:hypothetical protein